MMDNRNQNNTNDQLVKWTDQVPNWQDTGMPVVPEVERSVLLNMLQDVEKSAQAMATLSEQDFYVQQHQLLFKALQHTYERGESIDYVTLATRAQEVGLQVLASDLISDYGYNLSASVEQQVLILKEKRMLRYQLRVGNRLAKVARDPSADPFALQEKMMDAVVATEEMSDIRQARATNEHINALMQKAENATQEDFDAGVQTGIASLDEIVRPMEGGKFVVVGARPSIGKTAFVLSWLRNLSDQGVRSAFYSLEQDASSVVERFVSMRMGFPYSRFLSGNASDEDWQQFARASGYVSDMGVYIDDSPSLTLAQLRAKVKMQKIRNGVEVVAVDYLQLMDATADTREQAVASLSRGTKQMARDQQVIVVAVVQLNRSVEQRTDKRPRISDIRASGQVEQDADLILMLYRDEYYGITIDENGHSTEGVGEALIRKQRNGPVGDVRLAFRKSCTEWAGLSDRDPTYSPNSDTENAPF